MRFKTPQKVERYIYTPLVASMLLKSIDIAYNRYKEKKRSG